MTSFQFDSVQSRFTTGELIPEGHGREDISQYGGGLARAKNVQVLGIGALQRRGGLRLCGDLFSGTIPDDRARVRMINFRFNAEQDYILVFTHTTIRAFIGGDLVWTLNNPDFILEWDFGEMGFAQEADTLLLFHKDKEPLKLVRNGRADFTLSRLLPDIKNIPRFAFGGEVQTTGQVRIVGNGTNGVITLENVSVEGFTLQQMVGQYIEFTGKDTGRVRVLEVAGTFLRCQVVNEITIDPLNDDDTNNRYQIIAGEWQLQTGYEPIWSEARGYPHRASFHQGRLWLDGGRSLPSFLYGSKANDFFNFDFGSGLDDEAIGALRTDFNEIENIYSARALIVFANHAEYILPQTAGEAVTPSNASLQQQTQRGSFSNMIPYESDGGMLFVDRNGRSVRYFIYSETEEAFGASDTSLLSSHLIDNPRSFGVRQQLSADEPTYISLVRTDGNATLGTFHPDQSISAYTDIETEYELLDTASDINSLYFIGVINNRYDLLQLDNEALLDGATIHKVSNGVLPSSITHNLTGQSLRVVGKDTDGKLYIIDKAEVAQHISGNSVNIQADWFSNATSAIVEIQVGLDFDIEIRDLPVAYSSQRISTVVGWGKMIDALVVSLEDTHGIAVCKPVIENGKEVMRLNHIPL